MRSLRDFCRQCYYKSYLLYGIIKSTAEKLRFYDMSDIVDDNQRQQTQNASFRRCYCNLPSCVKTGYMCKSTAGACFAQLSLDSSASDGAGSAHVRYACAEFLPSETDRQACHVTAGDAGRVTLRRRGLPTTASSETESDQWAETVCCATDMCNYYYFRSTGSVQQPVVDGETSALGLLISRCNR
jgi:hypothetical protein